MRDAMKDSQLQRGQAMVLLALAFVGLAAFTGLAVDSGILFIQIGHLRRAADAASLAAANQFREGRTTDQIDAAADEFINLNSLNPAEADIFICDLNDPTSVYHDPNLCPPNIGHFNRKFVRVEASMPVSFAFLPIVGWGEIDIHAEAVSETASVDLVLVIDTSPSMAYDAACDDNDDDDGDGFDDDCESTQEGATPDDYYRDPAVCNGPRECHPFEEVRAAALQLVTRMYFPYDRMAVVTFDEQAHVRTALTDVKTDVVNELNAMEVSPVPGTCTYQSTQNPTGCTSTNIADGLKVAGQQFCLDKNGDSDCDDLELGETRPEAVWIVILLTDGGANAATDGAGNWICPGTVDNPNWVAPFCRDPDSSTRHPIGDAWYDPEDAAMDMALFVGCPDSNSPQPAGCAPMAPGGQGAVIFTIGLGELMTDSKVCDPTAYPPGYPTGCEPDQGEKLMRYIAGVGDDGDPDTPSAVDPCYGKPVGVSCGNYYYSPTGSGLLKVFEAIASRIFTRITH